MEKEYNEILSFWVRHDESKIHYFRFTWKHMVATLVKHILKGNKIYFTVVKACDSEEYRVNQQFNKN